LSNCENIFLAAVSGFFLTIFSKSFFGVEIIVLILISIFVKKIQSSLIEKDEKHPFVYFAPLFIISFIIFELFLQLSFYINNHLWPSNLNWLFLFEIFYNLIFATIAFYISKKFLIKK
jgi:hypothetical protein